MLLAGESGSAPPSDLRELLTTALAENGVELPDRVATANTLEREYAEQVVSGALAPVAGARRIIELYLLEECTLIASE